MNDETRQFLKEEKMDDEEQKDRNPNYDFGECMNNLWSAYGQIRDRCHIAETTLGRMGATLWGNFGPQGVCRAGILDNFDGGTEAAMIKVLNALTNSGTNSSADDADCRREG